MSTNGGSRVGASSLAINGGTPIRADWLPYGRQTITESDIEAVTKTLRSDWLTQGPQIQEFEDAVASICGTRYAVAFSNGTAALHGAYFAAGIDSKAEVITSAMTFAATSNAALYLGAQLRYADIHYDSGNIDSRTVQPWITQSTRAIVGIDYSGNPCDVDSLMEIAHPNKIPVIIDGAHSLGATHNGKPVGSLADMTTFSFHPVKTITTGEGGMVVTNNAEYAQRLRLFCSHGIEKDRSRLNNSEPWYHEMQLLGYNYRLTDLQAALGISQLSKLQSFIQRRREIANQYRKGLSRFRNFSSLAESAGAFSAYHLFPVLITEGSELSRDFVVRALHAENIGVQVHYIPTYRHPYHQTVRSHDWKMLCPSTEQFFSNVLSLPIFPSMTDSDVETVLCALEKFESTTRK